MNLRKNTWKASNCLFPLGTSFRDGRELMLSAIPSHYWLAHLIFLPGTCNRDKKAIQTFCLDSKALSVPSLPSTSFLNDFSLVLPYQLHVASFWRSQISYLIHFPIYLIIIQKNKDTSHLSHEERSDLVL